MLFKLDGTPGRDGSSLETFNSSCLELIGFFECSASDVIDQSCTGSDDVWSCATRLNHSLVMRLV